MNSRISREMKTLNVMIALHCRAQHDAKPSLCLSCRELADYAAYRLDKCPFRDEKPTCAKCTVHCYSPAMRERIRAVMRYAGPRMLLRHPVMAVRHLLDERTGTTARGRRYSETRSAGGP